MIKLYKWICDLLAKPELYKSYPIVSKTYIPKVISDDGLNHLKLAEGYKNTLYKDSQGYPTIGVGHLLTEKENTKKVIVLSSGQEVSINATWTEAQISELLRDDLVRFHKAVNTVGEFINQGQFDALVNFAFNIGVTGFLESTAVKRIKEGAHDKVPAAILLWNKPKEIIGRRQKEAEMYKTATINDLNNTESKMQNPLHVHSPNELVEQFIGTAYDTVKAVSSQLDIIAAAVANEANINSAAGISEEIIVIEQNLATIQILSDNIEDVQSLGPVASSISTVSQNIPALLTVIDNLIAVNTVSDNIDNVNTVANLRIQVEALSGVVNELQTLAPLSQQILNLDNIRNDIIATAASIEQVQNVSNHVNELSTVANNINVLLNANTILSGFFSDANLLDQKVTMKNHLITLADLNTPHPYRLVSVSAFNVILRGINNPLDISVIPEIGVDLTIDGTNDISHIWVGISNSGTRYYSGSDSVDPNTINDLLSFTFTPAVANTVFGITDSSEVITHVAYLGVISRVHSSFYDNGDLYLNNAKFSYGFPYAGLGSQHFEPVTTNLPKGMLEGSVTFIPDEGDNRERILPETRLHFSQGISFQNATGVLTNTTTTSIIIDDSTTRFFNGRRMVDPMPFAYPGTEFEVRLNFSPTNSFATMAANIDVEFTITKVKTPLFIHPGVAIAGTANP